MEDVLSKVKENLKLLINETDAFVTNDDLPEITADENQMIQVLQNLIENGIKFSNEAPRIHISSKEKDGNLYHLSKR
jgi:light-regulated signal transduction histidine kinase (bacteriophytochrome)